MKIEQELKLKQTQKLVMTPELRQAIALLQMSTVQLMDYMQEELINNPVLEWEEDDQGKSEENAENKEKENENEEKNEEEFQWEYYFQENFMEDKAQAPMSEAQSASTVLENTCFKEESALDQLCSQIRMALKKEDQTLAEYLVGCLDSNGYLRMELEDISNTLSVSLKRVKEVLKALQESLEPAGIGARNLRECLSIQLRRRGDYSELVEKLVKYYLPAVADGRYQYLADKLEVSYDELLEAVEYIKSLNPKPGNLWGTITDTRYITPDVIVEKVEGDYVISIPESLYPGIRINPYYRNLLKERRDDASTYVKKCLDRALWLMKSIEQRRLTLYRVSEFVVKEQREFLEHGLKHLKPLTLKNVAEALELHESTVSRATSNKYMQTPRGLFPFKFFFSSSLPGEKGQNYSSTSIKTYLKELIQQEPREKPYSDSDLAHKLKEKGIDISRRTVAKYREEIGILSSQKRKQTSSEKEAIM